MRPSYQFARAKAKSKQVGQKFNLTKKGYFELLSGKICTYCNGPLEGTGSSLDRLDSNKGYVIGNVVACCRNCNTVKNNLITPEEFKKIIELLEKSRSTKQVWAKYRTRKKGKR